MIVKMRPTGRTIVGYDHDSGRVVRRKVYEDSEGTEYVRLGTYSATDPNAHVERKWFCKSVLNEQYITRVAK
jgi:hypothetical protein